MGASGENGPAIDWAMEYSNAVEANDLERVKIAVEQHGVSVETRIDDGSDSTGVQHCASQGYYDLAEYLLQRGAKAGVIQFGQVRAAVAKSQGFPELAELLFSYMGAGVEKPERVTGKDALFDVGQYGNTPMDHPTTWQNFDALVVRLNAIGDPLTKEDLLAENSRGVRWIEKAAMHGELTRVVEYLNEIEQPLALNELVAAHPDASVPSPTPLLENIAWYGQASALFREEDWEDRTPGELRQLYQAVPEESRADIHNYHSLSASVSRQARLRSREGGEIER